MKRIATTILALLVVMACVSIYTINAAETAATPAPAASFAPKVRVLGGAVTGDCVFDPPSMAANDYVLVTCHVDRIEKGQVIYLSTLPNVGLSDAAISDNKHFTFKARNQYGFTINLNAQTVNYIIIDRTLGVAVPAAQVTATATATATATPTPTLTPTPTATST